MHRARGLSSSMLALVCGCFTYMPEGANVRYFVSTGGASRKINAKLGVIIWHNPESTKFVQTYLGEGGKRFYYFKCAYSATNLRKSAK